MRPAVYTPVRRKAGNLRLRAFGLPTTILERPQHYGTPVEFLRCRLDVAARGAYVTVAEFRHDDRFRGIADGGDLLSQLMDGGCDARPDVEAASAQLQASHRSEQRVDDIIDKDEIAHDPSVFVDLQRALLRAPIVRKGRLFLCTNWSATGPARRHSADAAH